MRLSLFAGLAVGMLGVTSAASSGGQQDDQQLVLSNDGKIAQGRNAEPASPMESLRGDVATEASFGHSLGSIYLALNTMQSEWFQLWIGTWPSAIDWTAAVINTYVSSALMTFTGARRRRLDPHEPMKWCNSDKDKCTFEILAEEKLIDKFFAHNTAFYFGENAFSLRNQAFDDMLWVVLGWLQSVKFIKSHSDYYYHHWMMQGPWHGSQFIPAFAHRARIFHELASKGWDTTLCGGGMVWNPNLEPYKNAITNQLYISASISMYLYFPGDWNRSPYLSRNQHPSDIPPPASSSDPWAPPGSAYDPAYLAAAIEAYAWLKSSNMTNTQGLYVDGYHITSWSRHNRTGTGHCDARNEMVYTYNQGVILSGLRGLWEGTGNSSYLQDGHDLVSAVVAATGYDASGAGRHNYAWSGLGRGGVMEDYCDARGSCNQDGQTFKGIFFQHLVQFCAPLPSAPVLPGRTHGADDGLRGLHARACEGYAAWTRRNAAAASRTEDWRGRFGMWWNAHLIGAEAAEGLAVELPAGAVDWRNELERQGKEFDDLHGLGGMPGGGEGRRMPSPDDVETMDLNDRGRGRTVETQGGGLSVLRAAYELSQDH